MEQVHVLLPAMEEIEETAEKNDFAILSNVKYGCGQLKDQFMAIFNINYKDVSVSNSSANILTYLTNMHDYIQNLIRYEMQLLQCLDNVAKSSGSTSPRSMSPRRRDILQKIEQVIVESLSPIFKYLPPIFELPIHDFCIVFSHTILLISRLRQIHASGIPNNGEIKRSIDILHQKFTTWQKVCLSGLFDTMNMVLLIHCLHMDWGSHSMFQRNKKFSPSIVSYLTTIRSLLYSVCEHCRRERKEQNAADLVLYSLPVILEVLQRSIQEIVRMYTVELSPSRVRLWLFKADMVYLLLNMLSTMDYLREYLDIMCDPESAIPLDLTCALFCSNIRSSIQYLLWYLFILFHDIPNELIAYYEDVVSDLQPSNPLALSQPYGDLREFFCDLEGLIRSTTNLRNAYEEFIEPTRSGGAAIESASYGDIRYNYSADVTCLLGLATNPNIDQSKSKEANGYTYLQSKLIDIVGLFRVSNPLQDAGSRGVVEVLCHAHRLTDSLYDIPASPEQSEQQEELPAQEIKSAMKMILLKRYDVQDCDYPALTDAQIEIYNKFWDFIKKELIA